MSFSKLFQNLKSNYQLNVTNGAVTGVAGDVLDDSSAPRGHSTSRSIKADFEQALASLS